MGGGPIAKASIVALMPGILGDESSSSKGEDFGSSGAFPSGDVEVRSAGHHHSMKAPLVEESEDESKHEPPPVRPRNATPLIC